MLVYWCDANNGYKVTYKYYPKEAQERITLLPVISPGGTIIPGGFQIVTTPDGTTGYIQTVTTYNINAGTETLSKTETVVYDANGNITQYGGNTYVYDNLNRLTRENNVDLGNHAVNKQLRAIGLTLNMGAKAMKQSSGVKSLSNAVFKSNWSKSLVSAQVVSGIGSNIFFMGYNYISNRLG